MAHPPGDGNGVQITFNGERQLLGPAVSRNSIDGLHYPLFWAAFHPGLGCFAEQHVNGSCELQFVIEIIDLSRFSCIKK